MKWLLLLSLSFLTSCSLTKMKADKLFKKGNFDQARELYVKVLKEDPNDEEALSNKKIAEKKSLVNLSTCGLRK